MQSHDEGYVETPHRAKKNTKKWCKGKKGQEHVLEIQKSKWPYQTKCEPIHFWNDGWFCVHEYVCVKCGKIVDRYLGSKCPEYVPS